MIDLLFEKKWTIIKVVLPTFFYKKLVFGPFLRVELLDLTEKTATSSSSTGHFGHSARSSSSACYPAVIRAIKSKLRNSSAISMVDAILRTRYSLTRGNKNCSKFDVLPKMVQWFISALKLLHLL